MEATTDQSADFKSPLPDKSQKIVRLENAEDPDINTNRANTKHISRRLVLERTERFLQSRQLGQSTDGIISLAGGAESGAQCGPNGAQAAEEGRSESRSLSRAGDVNGGVFDMNEDDLIDRIELDDEDDLEDSWALPAGSKINQYPISDKKTENADNQVSRLHNRSNSHKRQSLEHLKKSIIYQNLAMNKQNHSIHEMNGGDELKQHYVVDKELDMDTPLQNRTFTREETSRNAVVSRGSRDSKNLEDMRTDESITNAQEQNHVTYDNKLAPIQNRLSSTSTNTMFSDTRINSLDEINASRGKLVVFYKNGDVHFKGLRASVSIRQFKRFETLLKWLDDKIPTTRGIRHIFQLPEGLEIHDVAGFVNGRSYVVASSQRLLKVAYGDSRERYWINKPPSGSRYRKAEYNLFQVGSPKHSQFYSYPGSRTSSHNSYQYPLSEPTRRGRYGAKEKKAGHYMTRNLNTQLAFSLAVEKPRVLTIISNTNRNSREKVILNPNTTQTYEEMLEDIGSMVRLSYPPVKSLWTSKRPHKKVKGFSHLLRALRHVDTFLAVGQENRPSGVDNRKLINAITPDLIGSDVGESLPSAALPAIDLTASNKQTSSQKHSVCKRCLINVKYPALNDPFHGLTNINSKKLSMENPLFPSRKKLTPPGSFKNIVSSQRFYSQEDLLNEYAREVSIASQEDIEPSSSYKPPSVQNHVYAIAGRKVEETSQSSSPTEQDVVEFDVHGRTKKFYVPRYDKFEPDGGKPNRRLKLDWVYGYHGKDARDNLYLLSSGELVYNVATVAVVLHPKSETQRHYTEHNENITSISVHPSSKKPLIATGQLSGQTADSSAHIRVWDANSLVTYAIVGFGLFETSILSIAFSKQTDDLNNEPLLLAIDKSEKHSMSLWNWKKDDMIAKTSTTSDTVMLGQFHPNDYTSLVTCGKQHIYFWKVFWNQQIESSGKILRDKQSGLFQDGYDPALVTSIAFAPNGDVITGDSDGGMVVWQQDQHEAYVMARHWATGLRHAHQKEIFSLRVLDDGTLLSAGGTTIRAWNTQDDYRLIKQSQISSSGGTIVSMATNTSQGLDSHLYLGTSQNTVLQGSVQSTFSIIVQGSYKELWALSTHPSSYVFVTAGTDQQVHKWNALTHRLEWRTVVEKPCMSADINSTGKVIVVGTTAGRFIALSALDGMHIFSMQAGTRQIGVVCFSPDSKYLAVGSHDCSIYVYRVEDEAEVFRRHNAGVLRGHNNFVTHVDWSRDGQHLRSISDDHDLLFWSINEMREVTSESMRDIDWFSHSCILSYDTLGAWSNLKAGEDINTTDVSHTKDLLAVGDNKGSVRLYKHPCIADKPRFEEKKSYTGHVTRVAFTFDDHFLLSSGGSDAALLQWTYIQDR